jgi:hypothetical protein
MNSFLQIFSDWRILFLAGISVIYVVRQLFKGESSSEDIAALVERFNSELAAAETAFAHDPTAAAAFEPKHLHSNDLAEDAGAGDATHGTPVQA